MFMILTQYVFDDSMRMKQLVILFIQYEVYLQLIVLLQYVFHFRGSVDMLELEGMNSLTLFLTFSSK